MKKSVAVVLVLLTMAALSGTASAKALGTGVIFGVGTHLSDRAPELILPSQATNR